MIRASVIKGGYSSTSGLVKMCQQDIRTSAGMNRETWKKGWN